MWRGEGGMERASGRDAERGQKVGGWRRIMDSLLTNALPEVVVGGGKHGKKKRKMKSGEAGKRENQSMVR